jgi:hypothetical protein
MPKRPISVTLSDENLLWLRGQVRSTGQRSVSAALDRVVSAARMGAWGQPNPIRSVVGTIRIAASDPALARADAAVRALFPPSPTAGRPRPSVQPPRARPRTGRARG